MTKEELSQLYWLNREIEEDKRKLAELETAAEGGAAKITGMPHVSGNGRSLENYAVLIAEQRELIDTKIRQTIILYNRLNRYIAAVPDSFMRLILTFRYVNGMSWLQVAMRIGGGNTPDSVRKADDRFLKKN